MRARGEISRYRLIHRLQCPRHADAALMPARRDQDMLPFNIFVHRCLCRRHGIQRHNMFAIHVYASRWRLREDEDAADRY